MTPRLPFDAPEPAPAGPGRVYRVRLWTGGAAGKGSSITVLEQGRSARQAGERSLARARRLVRGCRWAVGGVEWIKGRVSL